MEYWIIDDVYEQRPMRKLWPKHPHGLNSLQRRRYKRLMQRMPYKGFGGETPPAKDLASLMASQINHCQNARRSVNYPLTPLT